MLSMKNTALGRMTSHLLVLSMIISSASSSCGRRKQSSHVKEVMSDTEEPNFKHLDESDYEYGGFPKERPTPPARIDLEPSVGMHLPEYGAKSKIDVSSTRDRGERDYVFSNPPRDYNPATNEIRMPEVQGVRIAPHAASSDPTSASQSQRDYSNHRSDEREFVLDSVDKSWNASSQFADAVAKRKADFNTKLNELDQSQHKDLAGITGMMKRHNDATDDVLAGIDLPISPPKEFRTPEDSVQGRKVRIVSKAIDEAESALKSGADSQSEIKQNAIGLARIQTSAADLAYSDGDVSTGDSLLHGALISLDLVLSFVPGVGLAKDLASLATGVNIITGDRLTNLDKGLITAGILVPGMIVGAVKATRYAKVAMAAAAGFALGGISSSPSTLSAASSSVSPSLLATSSSKQR